MNLPPKIVRQIERGEKTQHRVLVKPPRWVTRPGPTPRGGKRPQRTGDSARYLSQPFKPGIGDSLIVQTAREHEIEANRLPEIRVLVTDLHTAPVGDTTTAGALLEGHPTLHAFADHWMRRHDQAWPPQTEALCKECDGWGEYRNRDDELVDCDHCELGVIEIDDKPAPEIILDRFERKHGHHLVHVITFELQTDVTRFLNRRQYMPPTTSVGAALDPTAPLLGPPSKEWRQRAEALRRQDAREQDGALLAGLDRWAAELEAETQLLALLTDVDPSHDMFVIRQRIDRLKRKIEQRTERRAA